MKFLEKEKTELSSGYVYPVGISKEVLAKIKFLKLKYGSTMRNIFNDLLTEGLKQAELKGAFKTETDYTKP